MVNDYNDMISWAEKAVPSDLYDDFKEWIEAIKANFKRHKHYFPRGMELLLESYWEEKYGALSDEAEEELEKIEEKQKPTIKDFERVKQLDAQRASFARRAEQASKRRIRREKRQKFTKRLTKRQRQRKRGIGR